VVAGLSPGGPCGFDGLLECNSLVVELVEELVSVAVGIDVSVVCVLEVIKSCLDGVVLGLDVLEEGSGEVTALVDPGGDLLSEAIGFPLSALELFGLELVLGGSDVALKGDLSSLEPLDDVLGLLSLWVSDVVDEFLNGISVVLLFFLEVALVLWLL
jgi:hypothetical protein